MKYSRLVILFLAGWYVLLVGVHYLNQRPLWNDEQCIFININRYSPLALFSKPLLSLQVFPRFYLFLIQQFSRNFHFYLLALRFLPFVCMLTAFGVWMQIASREFKGKQFYWALYILCWAASLKLIYHAAELKQYSMDVLASGVCLWCLLQGFSRWWYLLPFFCFVSYPSVFWIPLFAWELIQEGRRRGQWRPLAMYAAAAGVAFLIFYNFDLRVSDHNLISRYWHDYFISFGSWGVFFDTLGKSLNNLISRWFAEKPLWIRDASRFFVGIGLVYMLAAFWRKFKEDKFSFRSVGSAAFGIFCVHLILGALHVYPFVNPRTSLFFCPPLLMVTVIAMQKIREFHKNLGGALQLVFVMYLIVVSLGIAHVVFAGDLGAQSVLFW